MSVPDYQSLMLPLLQLVSDGNEWLFRNAVEELAKKFSLTEEERRELLPSGQQEIFDNRVGWARTYMKKAGLLDSPKRGIFKITNRGLEVLKKHPDRIDVKFLKQYPEFLEFQSLKRADTYEMEKTEEQESVTPEEALENSHLKLKATLKHELLEKIKISSPLFFENLVVDLLLKMGYGGSRIDAGRAIGRSGDGGIDGIIKEDKLGLDIIYIQAKRWENTVPVNSIRDFAGSLLGKKARKGIFITTSNFPKSAYEFVEHLDHKIILIDGDYLTDLMIEHNIAVSTQRTYEIKKIDSDYFGEE